MSRTILTMPHRGSLMAGGETILFLLTSVFTLLKRRFCFLSTHLPNWAFRLGCSGEV